METGDWKSPLWGPLSLPKQCLLSTGDRTGGLRTFWSVWASPDTLRGSLKTGSGNRAERGLLGHKDQKGVETGMNSPQQRTLPRLRKLEVELQSIERYPEPWSPDPQSHWRGRLDSILKRCKVRGELNQIKGARKWKGKPQTRKLFTIHLSNKDSYSTDWRGGGVENSYKLIMKDK